MSSHARASEAEEQAWLSDTLLASALLASASVLAFHDAVVYPTRPEGAWFGAWLGMGSSRMDALGRWLEACVTWVHPTVVVLVALGSVAELWRSWRAERERALLVAARLSVCTWSWAQISLALQRSRWLPSTFGDELRTSLVDPWTPSLGAMAVLVLLVVATRTRAIAALGLALMVVSQSTSFAVALRVARELAAGAELALVDRVSSPLLIASGAWWLGVACLAIGVALPVRGPASKGPAALRQWLPLGIVVWLAGVNPSLLANLEPRATHARLQDVLNTHHVQPLLTGASSVGLQSPVAILLSNGEAVLIDNDRATSLRAGERVPKLMRGPLTVIADRRLSMASLERFLSQVSKTQRLAFAWLPSAARGLGAETLIPSIEAAQGRIRSVPIYRSGDAYPRRTLRAGKAEPVDAKQFVLTNASLSLDSLPRDVDYLVSSVSGLEDTTQGAIWTNAARVTLAGSALLRLDGRRWLLCLVLVAYLVLSRGRRGRVPLRRDGSTLG